MKTKLLGMICVLALTAAANADTFSISASFDPSTLGAPPVTLSGMFSINNGHISGQMLLLSLPALPQQPGVVIRGYWPGNDIQGFNDPVPFAGSWLLRGGSANFGIDINLVIAGDLLGYRGGPITSGVARAGFEECYFNGSSYASCAGGIAPFSLLNGSITDLTPLATPLPAALPLFATGLGMFYAALRCRKKILRLRLSAGTSSGGGRSSFRSPPSTVANASQI